LIMPSQSPRSWTSGVRWERGSRLIKIWGTFRSTEDGINATGLTWKKGNLVFLKPYFKMFQNLHQSVTKMTLLNGRSTLVQIRIRIRKRTYLETWADHDEQIDLVLVLCDRVVKLIAQALAEEHDVRLQNWRYGEI
jgi:hypothetical protein